MAEIGMLEIVIALLLVCIAFIIVITTISKIHQKRDKKLQDELKAENAMLEAVFNVIPDFMFCKDLNRKYTRVNKRFEDYFGVSADYIIGKDDEEGLKLPADIVRTYREYDLVVLNERIAALSEEYVPGANGEMILCETVKVPIIQNGVVVGLTGISRDITHHKELENDLKVAVEKSEFEAATLNAIFDSIPDFIFCKDTNLKYTRCNRHMEVYFGVREADLIGKDDAEGLGAPPEMVETCNESDMKIITNGELTVSEEYIPGAEGALILCETIKVPIITNGEIVGLTGVSRDVTERKANEEAAQAASIAKGEFLSRMSHEMRTPLNAIIGMINVGMASDDVARKDYCFERAVNASKHLLSIINDILDMSKLDAGRFNLSNNEFSFVKMIESIRELELPRISEKQQDFIIDIKGDVPAYIFCDELRLSQVITNLISNAIKFTPEKGTITLNAGKIEETDDDVVLRVEVTDTGIGISQEQQESLFDSFSQGDIDISLKFGGTGLGLAISKKIVELMGGDIRVVSEPGQGASFIFTIKVKKAERETVAGPARGKKDFSAHTFLIAEDIDINREVLAAILEETGVILDFAENGKLAVSMFSDDPDKYSLILMDINMPVMDGYEATRIIRALDLDAAKSVPIIAMTANVFQEDIDKCIEAGMTEHTGKPVDAEALFKVLEEHLAKNL